MADHHHKRLRKVNLASALKRFANHWDPHVVADYNDNEVMVVKFAGEFPFHRHAHSDDFFLVLEGEITIDGENGDQMRLGAGELCVVPAGMLHRPRAVAEARVLLIEPAGEPNTGDPATAAAKPRLE